MSAAQAATGIPRQDPGQAQHLVVGLVYSQCLLIVVGGVISIGVKEPGHTAGKSHRRMCKPCAILHKGLEHPWSLVTEKGT